MAARAQGADTFHCDSVKNVITWAKKNMNDSKLSDIHWVLDDALSFAQREVKRGHKYHGIIMDPPTFGRAKNGQRWQIEEKFSTLLQTSLDLIHENGFVLINTYSAKLKTRELEEMTSNLPKGYQCSTFTLCMKTTSGKRLEFGQLTQIRHLTNP